MSGNTFNRFTDIYNTIRWSNNRVSRFTNTFNTTTSTRIAELQRIKQFWMFLQLRRTIAGTDNEHACNGTDVEQTNDLRNKTGDPVTDL